MKLLGLGSGAMDTVISCSSLPGGDSFQRIESERLVPGGSCANMLCAYASLGGAAQMTAKIGDDEFGRSFRKTLELDGVDSSLLLVKPGGVTLHTYIWAAENGEHCIFANTGDSLFELGAEEVDESFLEEVELFYSDLMPAAPAVKLAKICKERGIPVIICLECPPSFLEDNGINSQEIKEALELADLIVSGREGYFELAGASYAAAGDYAAALKAVYERFKPGLGAICTAGDKGAVWVDGSETVSVPVYKVKAIDSTGAGDGFLGALLYSRFAEGKSRPEAMDFASAVGAMKCLTFGPRIKVGHREVLDFMENNRREINLSSPVNV